MSNRVRIILMEERTVGFDFMPTGEPEIGVYICCNEMNGWIGSAENMEELMKVAGPENLIESMNTHLSEYELECIMNVLECNDYTYYMENKAYRAIL